MSLGLFFSLFFWTVQARCRQGDSARLVLPPPPFSICSCFCPALELWALLFGCLMGRGRCCLSFAAWAEFAFVTENRWKMGDQEKVAEKEAGREKHQARKMPSCCHSPLCSHPLFTPRTILLTPAARRQMWLGVQPAKERKSRSASKLHPQLHPLGWRGGGGCFEHPKRERPMLSTARWASSRD